VTAAPGARDHALPVLSGVLLACSFPPTPLAPLIFLGLVPLLLFIADRPADERGRWQATRGGAVAGVVYFGIQLYWMAVALIRYSLLAIPAYLGAVLVLASLAGAFAWAVHLVMARLRLPMPLLAALFWTALEWVQAHLGDLAFPWLGLGTALAPLPTLAGAADLVGARGLTFWIAGVNGLVAAAILRHRSGRRIAPTAALLLAVLALPAAYGVIRGASLSTRPAARVALVQPNVPEEVKLGPAGRDSSLAALTALTLALEGETLDLVAWPEVALPADLLAEDRLLVAVRDLAARVGAPILVGAYGTSIDGSAGAGRYNSAFLVRPPSPALGPHADPPLARYDKQRLVPFIERVPFVGPGHADTDAAGAGRPHMGGLRRGGDRALMTAGTAELGVLICYESIFSDLSRDDRRAGADFLVNITNDAWYGRDTPVGRTTALWQHPAHLVLRAIETRTGIARAANTGISLFIDPLGRSYGETPLFEATTTVGTVLTTDVATLFVRWGDWVGAGAAALALLTLLASLRVPPRPRARSARAGG